ncbi:MAG: methyltransferase domain-containing protein [Spirochaetes bacterium]|nr:methyltransferase domain-containing protein [Spirochaetota bacterium]
MKIDIIFSAQFNEKIGYGHLKRILTLYDILKTRYNCILANIVPPLKKEYRFSRIPSINFTSQDELFLFIQRNKVKLVILDHFQHDAGLIKKLSSLCLLIIIDSKKMFKSERPVLYLNTLTPLKIRNFRPHEYYYSSFGLFPLNATLSHYITEPSKGNVLVTFGNSDPRNLTLKVLKKLNRLNDPLTVQIVIGQYFKTSHIRKIEKYLLTKFRFTYTLVCSPSSLYKLIAESQYIITSFGLTALEGVFFNRNVGLFNNSFYHAKLEHNFHEYFYHLGTWPFPLFMKKLFSFLKLEPAKREKISLDMKNNGQRIIKLVTAFIRGIDPIREKTCRICSGQVDLILNQFGKKIVECRHCGAKHLVLKKPPLPAGIYQDGYFMEEYKEQYGKTYLEDRKNIESLADKRLDMISRFIKPEGKKLFDIGCAYGFFLKRAEKRGFKVSGIEIEKNAADYARKKLKLDVQKISVLKYQFKHQFDIMTLWYVLEHFPDPGSVLKTITSHVKKGGMIALSCPHGNGIFYRFNRMGWLFHHSDDHFYDFTIRSLKILLKKFGYSLKARRITGIHPERMGIKNNFLKKIIIPVIRLLSGGDTVELYFKKQD